MSRKHLQIVLEPRLSLGACSDIGEKVKQITRAYTVKYGEIKGAGGEIEERFLLVDEEDVSPKNLKAIEQIKGVRGILPVIPVS